MVTDAEMGLMVNTRCFNCFMKWAEVLFERNELDVGLITKVINYEIRSSKGLSKCIICGADRKYICFHNVETI